MKQLRVCMMKPGDEAPLWTLNFVSIVCFSIVADPKSKPQGSLPTPTHLMPKQSHGAATLSHATACTSSLLLACRTAAIAVPFELVRTIPTRACDI